jgi:hypothetical protein
MDQDSWEDEDYEEHHEANWEEDEAADDGGSSSWDALAFQQKATFPPCTTPYCKEKNMHGTTRTLQIGAISYIHQKERGHLQTGDILFFL